MHEKQKWGELILLLLVRKVMKSIKFMGLFPWVFVGSLIGSMFIVPMIPKIIMIHAFSAFTPWAIAI